ncbi:hypothetical protein [Haloarcula salinisoli]|uniref:Uncharacterized protein n=1 Tax=Haloarcula salinisoli TaxID=2487746 RepID=A0A8J7YGE4_9EURY|nr:hypothetical protein [Halomicroarcula salinisoli]MBX0302239.1 hypothetical protein [Halomicroarcula salinisoli]
MSRTGITAADGSDVWRYETDQSSGAGHRAPAVVDGVTYPGGETLRPHRAPTGRSATQKRTFTPREHDRRT